MRDSYRKLLDLYAEILVDLEEGMENPVEVDLGAGNVALKFPQQDAQHAMIMKIAVAISGLNACMILLDAGHVFEIGVLERTIEDAAQDANFFAKAVVRQEWTKHHEKHLADFWAEPFDDAGDVTGTIRRSDGAKRDKIRSYLVDKSPDPYNAGRAGTTIFVLDSGYIHAHSRNIMEIYDHRTQQLAVAGVTLPLTLLGYQADVGGYLFRVGIVLHRIMKALHRTRHESELTEQLTRFAQTGA